jgi:hypothetical protein
MKRLIQSTATPLIGMLIVGSGLVYDILFAGIPYQDPTPELQARYDFHSSVASWFYKAGGIVLLIGIVAIPFIVKATKHKGANKAIEGIGE